ncbi:MAG TPA: hypothetical protein VGD09_00725 [Blastococcus sp.]
MAEVTVLHYPEVRAGNWVLMSGAARRAGVRLVTWEPHLLQVTCTDGGMSASYPGHPTAPAILLHRTVSRFEGIVAPAVQLWESAGSVVLNDISAAYAARDKLLTSMALSRAGVPIVATVAFFEPDKELLISTAGDHDVIVKPAHGVRGEGIRTFRSPAESVDRFHELPAAIQDVRTDSREHFLGQALVMGGGRDLRAYVVGRVCVALMERIAAPGEFRANLSLGATASPLGLGHAAAAVAVDAVQACGLDYAGVDLIEDESGIIRVLEIDAWAGFAGITEATGVDVAGAILRLALARRDEAGAG